MYKCRLRQSIITAVGKKKSSKAEVSLQIGDKLSLLINSKPYYCYFLDVFTQSVILNCFNTIRFSKFNVNVWVRGGGRVSQAFAVSHGIIKCLSIMNIKIKHIYRFFNLIQTDNRSVERKKSGHAKARKSFQFSKR